MDEKLTSLADQDETRLGGPWSILVRQKREHVRLDDLLDRLASTTGDEQDRVLNAICRLVFPHAFAEESVLWPELRRVLPDGDELTLQVEQEHQEVNELFTELERPDLSPERRRTLIARIAEVLREDVRDEEDELFPRLQAVLDVRRLRQLGVAWELVRRTAPTRPHPVVARRPPGNALAALPLTVLDRTRDVLDGGARRSARLRPVLVGASQGLARVAGRVEHVGVLRRGEHPSTHRG
jgi:hemerythrin superfamily protein